VAGALGNRASAHGRHRGARGATAGTAGKKSSAAADAPKKTDFLEFRCVDQARNGGFDVGRLKFDAVAGMRELRRLRRPGSKGIPHPVASSNVQRRTDPVRALDPPEVEESPKGSPGVAVGPAKWLEARRWRLDADPGESAGPPIEQGLRTLAPDLRGSNEASSLELQSDIEGADNPPEVEEAKKPDPHAHPRQRMRQ